MFLPVNISAMDAMMALNVSRSVLDEAGGHFFGLFDKEYQLLTDISTSYHINHHITKKKSMKYGINKVTLVGNVGDTPKVFEKEGELLNVSFPFATSQTYKDKNGEEVTSTQWHRVKAWNKKASIIQQYVAKGDSLYLEGKIVNNNWDDKEGNKHYSTEIECENFLFLSNRLKKEEERN